MHWRKLGLVFRPNTSKWWMRSHAALPVPLRVAGSTYRVYFAGRDAANRSHVGYFDVDLDNPGDVLRTSEEPVLAPGPLGYFDDHGVYAASTVAHDGLIYLYTIGWNPGPKPPLFYASVGLAISEDGGTTFRKCGRAPIMARSEYDPCLVTSPYVIKEGSGWRMWYVSGLAWERTGDSLTSRYHIKYAESEDGIHWRREGVVSIDFADPTETNIARTCVVKLGERYHAWFSTNCGAGYRIGHAISLDGIVWHRTAAEPAGLARSSSGWDSEAMAYPFVVAHRRRLYMFYNGNGFGRDGIGIAVSEELPPDASE